MHSYRFTINNYHAISHADIKIDGITVLSGVNGCGKSTLTRWLYYWVGITTSFRERLMNECNMKLYQFFSNLSNIETDSVSYLQRVDKSLKISATHPEIFIGMSQRNDWDKFSSQVSSLVRSVSLNLSLMNQPSVSDLRKKRVLKSLSSLLGGDVEQLNVETLNASISKSVFAILTRVRTEMESCKKNTIIRLLRSQLGETDALPESIQFYEDDVELIEKSSFSVPLGLRRAIYIDTPMGVGRNMPQVPLVIARDTDHWNQLQQMLLYPAGEMSRKGRKMQMRIQGILKGEVSIVKNDNSPLPELIYHSNTGLDIPIAKVATGFKSFSYLLKLLENGYLDENTVLIIDEPEVHLHPAWSFEFARCLVLLHKELGVSVVIASHNPDMVQTIRVLAEKEDVLDRTNFYLAESVGNERYNFCLQDKSIADIFKSFNEALRKIQNVMPANEEQ